MIQATRYSAIASSSDAQIARPLYIADPRRQIDDATVLTRYISHEKFVDFFGTQTLFFTRLLTLRHQDPDEGRIATPHYIADVRSHDEFGPESAAQRKAYRQFLEQGPHHQAYVSCWYIGSDESARMWREYVPSGRGVAIQTTVGRLRAQFNGVAGPDGIKQAVIAPITYGGWDDPMDGIEERDDPIAALKYKGRKWTHENEMRAVIFYTMYYIAPLLPKTGERLTVPLTEFLNAIILPPNARHAYRRAIRKLVSGTIAEKLLRESSVRRGCLRRLLSS